eukprot:GHVT01070101.1.p1 GENE.GHVT01070101.1~~GHVT01070101.1.p1  ORF type:complete len:183 (-),score=17.40 GHVT01070101.1:60-608(-)
MKAGNATGGSARKKMMGPTSKPWGGMRHLLVGNYRTGDPQLPHFSFSFFSWFSNPIGCGHDYKMRCIQCVIDSDSVILFFFFCFSSPLLLLLLLLVFALHHLSFLVDDWLAWDPGHSSSPCSSNCGKHSAKELLACLENTCCSRAGRLMVHMNDCLQRTHRGPTHATNRGASHQVPPQLLAQ